jgi:ABC-2 type transport system ATP-binding protein
MSTARALGNGEIPCRVRRGPQCSRAMLVPDLENAEPVPALELLGLTKRFGDFTAVDRLDLRILRGEIFGLLGPNGAGKTTTIRLLMGILKASAGTARILGRDCFKDRVELKRHVGYLPDEPSFHDYLRGSEIVRFVADMHGLDPGWLEELGRPLIERLELEGAMDEFAVNYSRGMKKKLALVCALAHQPSLLILDEPTSGLDPLATRELNALLMEQVAKGTTVVLSSHLLDQVQRLCSRMGIVAGGRLRAVGTLNELRRRATNESSLEDIFFAVATGDHPEVVA